jgi:hypothetical protein
MTDAGLKSAYNCAKPICWETYMGQQFYRLTVIDFFAQGRTEFDK